VSTTYVQPGATVAVEFGSTSTCGIVSVGVDVDVDVCGEHFGGEESLDHMSTRPRIRHFTCIISDAGYALMV
jgi:hypothetical protein